MSGFPKNDLFDNLFGLKSFPARPTTTLDWTLARRECEEKGHRYQVHGKTTPNKVVCARCEVSWAIGARTEPTR